MDIIMKISIKFIALVLAVMMILTIFVGCNKKEGAKQRQGEEVETDANGNKKDEEKPADTTVEAPKEPKVQGVTDTEIIIGNTAVMSGDLEIVGVPFNAAIKAVIKQVNEAGGIGGRTIKFISYDDEFNAKKAIKFTKKLIEEDKIFALVGHFGTPTVGATVDYIQEYGIPMVYAATGINALYFEKTLGNPIMAVQPIYKTDGRIMAARAFHESLYGPNQDQKLSADSKIGVLYTNDESGNGMLEGVKAQAEKDGLGSSLIIEKVAEGTYSTAVKKLKDAGVSVIIASMNLTPFKETMLALYDAGLEAPVFTSYVNADPTAIDSSKYSEKRPVYANAWVDVLSVKGKSDAQDFVAAIANSDLKDEEKQNYYTNSFATAGYIAAKVFIEGLKRVDAAGEDLNWDNYIKAMEQGPISVPLGGVVDYSDGKRWGIDTMSLLKYEPEKDGVVTTFVIVRPLESLADIELK
jgi:ABC-type branched-subunit amino acid transport system substrate-binding protein